MRSRHLRARRLVCSVAAARAGGDVTPVRTWTVPEHASRPLPSSARPSLPAAVALWCDAFPVLSGTIVVEEGKAVPAVPTGPALDRKAELGSQGLPGVGLGSGACLKHGLSKVCSGHRTVRAECLGAVCAPAPAPRCRSAETRGHPAASSTLGPEQQDRRGRAPGPCAVHGRWKGRSGCPRHPFSLSASHWFCKVTAVLLDLCW